MPFTGHSTLPPHHKKEGTPSPPLPLPPPIPESTHQRYSLAPSSAPSTPYSHHPSQLFYLPPPSSPPSPVPLPAMPALPPSAYTRDAAGDEQTSMRLSGYASSPDGSAFLARLPEGMEGVVGASTGAGVWRANGLDARVLAEMLAPRSRQGSASTKSGSSGGKGKKSKGGKSGKGKGKVEVDGGAGTVATPTATSTSPSENFSTPAHASAFTSTELDVPDTPPPVPPKPLAMASTTPKSTHTTHTAHTGRTYSSYSHSSHSASITTEHAVATAQHATRAAASSHHLTGASLSSLSGIAAATPLPSHTPTPYDGHRPESMYSYRSGMAAASDSSHRPSLSPSFSASVDPDPQRESQYLAKALASLPWAEPPPRQPSPLFPSPGVPGAVLLPAVSGASASGTPPASARTPTYSFLANDPVASYSAAGSHSRRSSASSTASRRAPSASAFAPPVSLPPIKVGNSQAHDALPSGVPVSPSLAGHSSEGGWGFSGIGAMQAASGYHRFSAWSTSAGGSGDAAAAIAGTSGSKTDSPGSAMATQASSSDPSRKLSSRSAKSAKSARFSFATATRTKSTKSTKSTLSTKRGSGSTLGHRFMGRWEVRKWEEIGEGRSAEGGEGEGSGSGRREKEETMDLRDLVGRAVVLERMLRHGRRVSAASLKRGYKESRFSISSRFTPTPTPPIPTHHPSYTTASAPSMPSRPSSRARSRSAGPSKGKGRPSSQLPSPRKSMSTAASGSGSGSGSDSGSGVRAKHGSMPASLRERIGKRLMRSRSREDAFTELGSSGSGSGSDSGVSDESGDEGMWAAESGVDTRGGGAGKRGSRRVSRRVSRALGAGAGPSGEKGERGEERVGGKGVLVFPEELEGPPTPPKDRHAKARLVPTGPTVSGGLLGCTSLLCDSPSSPTPLLSHLAHDPEKGLRHPQPGDSPDGSPTSSHASLSPSALGAKRYEQSPHLGHRSPDWRNRQSVLSYLSTKVWDPAVGPGETVWAGKGQGRRTRRRVLVMGLGAVVLVILIVGLLAGLLSKRGGQDE